MNRQERSDIYADVTATIMEALESGTAPWHKPWRAGQLPLSISTGKPYRGINPVLLNMAGGIAGYASPWWGTFGKIAEKSGMVKIMNLGRERWMSPDGQPRGVRKGEKSTMVTFWKKIMVDDRDNPGRKRPVFMLRVYRVFNAEQADWPDGAPAYETRDRNEGERIHEAAACRVSPITMGRMSSTAPCSMSAGTRLATRRGSTGPASRSLTTSAPASTRRKN